MSNLCFLSQTRSHYDHSRDEKNDCAKGESDRDRSSHLFCSRHHLYVSCHNACGASFFLSPSDLRGLSLLSPSPFALFVSSPYDLSPFCLSPPSPFSLSPSPSARSSRLTRSSSSCLARLISSSAFLAASTSFPVLAAPEYDFPFSVGLAADTLEL